MSLFSDIKDSTALTERLGDAVGMELVREHNRIAREQIATNNGYEVKSMGDGLMRAFHRATDGLRCAIGIQRAFAAHNDSPDRRSPSGSSSTPARRSGKPTISSART